MRRINRQNAEDKTNKSIRTTSIIINITNAILFGIGLTLFIIGILYLSIYRYEYSFTIFSIDLLASIFLSVGCILCLLGLCGVFLLKPLGRPVYSILYAIGIFLFFLLIFILGVIGLSMNNNGAFLNQNRVNMLATMNKFDESNQHGHNTKKINWLQKKFQCCGLDSYSDWKSIVTFQGVNGPVKFFGKYDNKYPYIDDVPDSCCINPNLNCGKNIHVFGRDRSQILNTKGCFQMYNLQFSKDVVFLSSLAVAISVLLLGLTLTLFFVFTLINRNANLAIESCNEQSERKVFI
ncbi:unnamed protein product [Brachionus calyciflorus]|uniref:Tetraspanin n=1 Tax=Brachionus calyciflorus TaxID=104777 RepID=A0A814G9M9_9BILA|nr:unnamed protein product [Brachionus calyciflorus]